MKKFMCAVLLAGFFVSSYATDARVLTMGGNDNFFMDDVSIFRNPANINYYPNMIIGSLGVYLPDSTDTGALAALRLNNKEPQKPYGGTILSYSLNQSSESGNQYPLLSFGLILNRYDPLLNYLDPGSSDFQMAFGTNRRDLVAPVGKIDLMLGYALQNGAMIGVGTYLAFQRQNINDTNYETSVYKANVGINWPIAKSMNLEVSFDFASLTGIGTIARQTGTNSPLVDTNENIAKNDLYFKGDIRLFSALTALNGDFVPHLSIERIGLEGFSQMNYSLGLGVNINIDKGFFWTGIEGLVEEKNYSKVNGYVKDSMPTGIGGRIGAGLERNVVWDWLVLRIGVNKKLLYVSDGGENGHWEQNPEADGSDDDFAAVGVGVNIENRFRIDGVLAENIFYTWTNLISAPQHHVMDRITLTYSF
ncbi:MAG TPA: hypothetical protein VLX68_14525 [Chitinivibrionales bacterium]|nr:hypothetical protein [Chitinivibrionales bacterium]